jgi:ABC-type glycerol-3-phosphate transport system substrate-binding protein
MRGFSGPARIAFCLLSVAAVLTLSCGLGNRRVAVVWTDRPEFVAYAEHFNSSQPHRIVEVRYRENPAEALLSAKEYPDIVVGSWLKSASTRALFKPMDYFFEDLLLRETSFYPSLLKPGNIDGKQYLLPVSFNVPALIFSRENSASIAKPFTLTPDDVKTLARAYNERSDGQYARMGFSPRWSDEFLTTMATLYGASFREGSPLVWDAAALERAIAAVRAWTAEANTDAASEDDFAFKYLYDPPSKLVTSGRTLFAYLTSDRLFTVPEETRETLDFRWIERESIMPVVEGAPYLGMCKRGKAHAAADAFVQWFYKEETQRSLLDFAKKYRTMEISFGIAGGFSSIQAVNEEIYPLFYPGLLGHVPPSDFISPPNILPKDWTVLKSRVVMPYLRDRASGNAKSAGATLEQRIADWYRQNPRK